MPEPALDPAPIPAPVEDRFTELRDLLVAPERDRLADLQARFDDQARRSADVAQVLPNAVRAAKTKTLRDALEPVLEKAFENSVRKHPKELADAIYPVIGPAIRNSIAASIREFAENLNQIVEKSASLRALRWRIEARVTGRPFTEILLARSLLYSVEQVFLIHRKSGLLLLHAAAKDSVLKDADMISGMLTAIQDFFSDSFTAEGQDLETVDTGKYKLWIQYGSKALVVGAVSGTAPTELKGVFRHAVDVVHQDFYAELDSFKQDDVTVFEPARPLLEACLLGQSGPAQKRRRTLLLWSLVACVVLLAAGGFWYRARQQSRWNEFVGRVKSQPGIVVTGVEKRNGAWVVSGLKDPLAAAPDASSAPAVVRYEWQPYLSLNTPFAAARDAAAARSFIEHEVIRFDVGSSKLPLSESGRIEAMAEFIPAHRGVRVLLTGHTDEVGSEGSNMKLSLDRALHAKEALVAQGVPSDRLETAGVGNTQPPRAGMTDWDKSTNRSVTFQMIR